MKLYYRNNQKKKKNYCLTFIFFLSKLLSVMTNARFAPVCVSNNNELNLMCFKTILDPHPTPENR